MYQNKLVRALAEGDPSALKYAATEFGALPRYVGDYDHSWFNREREFDEVLSRLNDTATAIMLSIRTFDPDSMAQARNAFMWNLKACRNERLK